MGGKRWAEEQDQLIRDLYPKVGLELAKQLGIDNQKLKNRACYLGVRFKLDGWTPERLERLKDYPTVGAVKLAQEFGFTVFSVTAKARRMGIASTRKLPPKDFSWTEERIQSVKDRYVREGVEKLAEEFNLSHATVRSKAVEFGLHTIAGHKRSGQKRAENSISCDIHYFDNWSPNMAYILGFLFADGCVSNRLGVVSINLTRKDEAVLDFMRMEMKIKSKIRRTDNYKDPRGWNTQPTSLLYASSTVMVKQLLELGLKPRKTYNDDPFPSVPDDMMPHFARGYLDGDGTCSIGSNDTCGIGFVGSPRFIEGLRDSLVKLANVKRKTVAHHTKTNTHYSSVSWSAIDDIKKLFTYLYPPRFTFCLERKRQNLVKWLSKPRYPRGHFFGNRFTGSLINV